MYTLILLIMTTTAVNVEFIHGFQSKETCLESKTAFLVEDYMLRGHCKLTQPRPLPKMSDRK